MYQLQKFGGGKKIKSLTPKNSYGCDEILVKILKFSVYYLSLDLHMYYITFNRYFSN